LKTSNNRNNTAFSVRILCLILAILMVGGALTGFVAYLLGAL
jgi:hypothetical protein